MLTLKDIETEKLQHNLSLDYKNLRGSVIPFQRKGQLTCIVSCDEPTKGWDPSVFESLLLMDEYE